MINIKSSSWHYKFYKTTSQYPPTNLCEYVQALFLSIFVWITAWPYALTKIFSKDLYSNLFLTKNNAEKIMLILLGCLTFSLGFLLLSDIIGLSLLVAIVFSQLASIISMGILLGILALCAVTLEAISNMFTKKISFKKNKPNLFIQYIKAKKEKHCPLITIDNTDET